MPDIIEPRKALAELLAGLLVAQQQNQDWFPPGGGQALCIDGWFDPKALAGAVLDAGVRPPARRIETPEQLDALPMESVVLDPVGYVWQAERRLGLGAGEHRWGSPFLSGLKTAQAVLREGAVTVLWEPEQEAGR